MAINESRSEIDIYSELIANFTHQIINPLNGVVGTLDNIVEGHVASAKRDQRLRAAAAQLINTIELVRNLAFLSNLSTKAGRQSLRELSKKSLIPRETIDAIAFFQELAKQEKGMEIQLLDSTQYWVKGHPDLLRQVFTNLLDNAVKYGDRDTAITVSVHEQKKTGNLILEVKNLGPGFDFNERAQIFERGFRGIGARSVKASGSGIGLFICKELLEAGFDAKIEAEYSSQSRETTFRIRFPSFNLEEKGIYVEG